jgi:hypothetical protein
LIKASIDGGDKEEYQGKKKKRERMRIEASSKNGCEGMRYHVCKRLPNQQKMCVYTNDKQTKKRSEHVTKNARRKRSKNQKIERTKMHTSTRTEEKTMMDDKANEKNVNKIFQCRITKCKFVRTAPRPKNQTLKLVTDSSTFISDLNSISYMISQDHTKNLTENRSLLQLTSRLTLRFTSDPTVCMMLYDHIQSFTEITIDLFTDTHDGSF